MYMDTSNVQSYTNNGNRVVYLDRRTQLKSKLAPNSPACHVCDRVVQEGYKYCSVWCRVAEWSPTLVSPGNTNLNNTTIKNNTNDLNKKRSPNGRKKNEHDASGGSSSSSLDNTARSKPTNPNSSRKPASNTTKATAAAFNNMHTNTTNSSLTATTNHTGDSPLLPPTTNTMAAPAIAAASSTKARKPGPYFSVDLSFGNGRESAVAASFIAARSSSIPVVSPARVSTTLPLTSHAHTYHASPPSGGNNVSLPPRSKFSGAPMKKQSVSTVSLIVTHKRSLPTDSDLVSPRPSKRKGNPVISPLL